MDTDEGILKMGGGQYDDLWAHSCLDSPDDLSSIPRTQCGK